MKKKLKEKKFCTTAEKTCIDGYFILDIDLESEFDSLKIKEGTNDFIRLYDSQLKKGEEGNIVWGSQNKDIRKKNTLVVNNIINRKSPHHYYSGQEIYEKYRDIRNDKTLPQSGQKKFLGRAKWQVKDKLPKHYKTNWKTGWEEMS